MFPMRKTYPGGEDGQTFSLAGGLEAFEKEVLFLVGSCGVVLGEELQREQMKYFPDARMVVIDPASLQPPVGCGRSPLRDDLPGPPSTALLPRFKGG